MQRLHDGLDWIIKHLAERSIIKDLTAIAPVTLSLTLVALNLWYRDIYVDSKEPFLPENNFNLSFKIL